MSEDSPPKGIGFSFDTEIMLHNSRAKETTITEVFGLGREVRGYGLSFEGDLRIASFERFRTYLNQELLELTINETLKVKVGPKQMLYNQHGVMYRAEELRIGQNLGGVSPQVRGNLSAVGEAKIHQSTGYFVVTGLRPLNEIENLYSVVGSGYGNYALACGLIAKAP